MQTGYERTAAVGLAMHCPVCRSMNTWRMKSLYIPGIVIGKGVDITEELWQCKDCKARWNYEQRIIMIV